MHLNIEENVKLKIVHVYLQSLGFQQDEINFETSFTLSLGTCTYKVDTGKQSREAHPRLDILVTRNGDNLFIVEVKSDLVEIDDKEVAQATSYARLVQPVAPFTIITNGKDFHLYDSLTRKEITQQDFKLKGKYEVSLPDDYRYEALKHFIGYSRENVRLFCHEQVKKNMTTLTGSAADRYKKFIPELYVSRKGVTSALLEFVNSGKSVFALLGDSGGGKTCAMCGSALEMLDNGHAVLFYRARDFVDGIAECVADDFNWHFSSELSDIQVFKRVADLFTGSRVLLFIEAVDEWDLPNKVDILSSFAKRISGNNVSIILTCKTAAWNSFLLQNSVPTFTSEATRVTHGQDIGYYLQPLDPQEFHSAVERYRAFYKFKGRFEDRVLEECRRTPFLLRVFFEVAQERGLRDLAFSSIEFFDRYYNLVLDKLGNREVADATLKGVAKLLLAKDSDTAESDAVRGELRLSVNENLMPSLFEYNVLEITPSRSGPLVGFAFAKFRDYLLSQHILKWDLMNVDDFASSIRDVSGAKIAQEALKFYYSVASTEKKTVIDGDVRANAEAYLRFYTEVIGAHFAGFITSFPPHTNGEIGFIAQLIMDERALSLYGFRALNGPDNERIKFIPVDADSRSKLSNVIYLHGGESLHVSGTANGFRKLDVRREVLQYEIERQLRHIIRKGVLNEINTPHLLIEKVLAVYWRRHYGFTDLYRRSQHLPIVFDQIEYALRYRRASTILQDNLVEEKRKAGLIEETWHGGAVSYSYRLSSEDQRMIDEQAKEIADSGTLMESPIGYLGLDRSDEVLQQALQQLRRNGYQEISELILPDADSPNRSNRVDGLYRDDTLREYAARVYRLFLDEYARLVVANFPSLKGEFVLYQNMPVKCFMVFEDASSDRPLGVRISICRHPQPNAGNEVVVCAENDLKSDSRGIHVEYQGLPYECWTALYTSIDHFLIPHRSYMVTDVADQLVPLRSLVYGQIEREMDSVIAALFAQYGISRSRSL